MKKLFLFILIIFLVTIYNMIYMSSYGTNFNQFKKFSKQRNQQSVASAAHNRVAYNLVNYYPLSQKECIDKKRSWV